MNDCRKLCAVLLYVGLICVSSGLNATEANNIGNESDDKMVLNLSNDNSAITVLREGTPIMVYQKNVLKNNRSIANAITELYAVNHTENLVSQSSPIVPPQVVVQVKDTYLPDNCENSPCNGSYCTCDYFAHSNVTLNVMKSSGDYVQFKVTSKSSQHNNNATPINYSTEMVVTIPYDPNYTIVEYDVVTSLSQKLNLGHAIRPMPFFEVVANKYDNIAYLDSSCQVKTVPIPTNITSGDDPTFIRDGEVCLNQTPWAAMYDNSAGNLGIVLQSWNWSSGEPRLYAYTEGNGKPNLYFQSSSKPGLYESENWSGKVIFLAYDEKGYEAIKRYAESVSFKSSKNEISITR